MGLQYNPEQKLSELAVKLAYGELRNIQYWNPISRKWQSTPPTFPVDHWNGLACEGVNLSGETRDMYMYFEAYGPNGVRRDNWVSQTFTIGPGGGFTANFGIYCDIPGDYRTTCQLIMDYYGTVDTINKVVCHATAVAEVKALITDWWKWDWETSSWVGVSPTLVPLYEDIGVRGKARNKSDFTINIRMDIKTHSPSGKTNTITGDVESVLPDKYALWNFIWAGDELGDWEADLILYAARPGDSLVEADRVENIPVAAVQEIGPPPEYKGTITKKQLEYDGTYKNIPVSNVPFGERGLVHVWGRNDANTTKQMGIGWIVIDPNGITVEQYSDWEALPFTGAGKEHEFIGGRFDLNKAGSWRLNVSLYMNRSDPMVVDSYNGTLCVVAGAPPIFTCPHCGVEFASEAELAAHIEAEHPEVPPVFVCPHCGVIFDTEAELSAHIKSEHPEEVEEKKFPWAPVAIGAGVVVVALLAAGRKR